MEINEFNPNSGVRRPRRDYVPEEIDFLIGKVRRKASEEGKALPQNNPSSKQAIEYIEVAQHINSKLGLADSGNETSLVKETKVTAADLWYFHYEYQFKGIRGINPARQDSIDLLYAYISGRDASYKRENFFQENPHWLALFEPSPQMTNRTKTQNQSETQSLNNADDQKATRRDFLKTAAIVGLTASSVGSGVYFKMKRPLVWNLVTPWVSVDAFSETGQPIIVNPPVGLLAAKIKEFVEDVNESFDGVLKIHQFNNLHIPPYGIKTSISNVYDQMRLDNIGPDAIHMFHASPYYRMLPSPSADNPQKSNIDWTLPYFFFSAIPFGMSDKILSEWIGETPEQWKSKEGYRLWTELYEDIEKEVKVFPAGMTSKQNSGWWRLMENSLLKNGTSWEMDTQLFTNTLKGKEARIIGFARCILENYYEINAKQYGSGELRLQMYANQELVLAEWLNAKQDFALGLHSVPGFKNYCITPWNEISTLIELTIKKRALDQLSKSDQEKLYSKISTLHKNIKEQFRDDNNEQDYKNIPNDVRLFTLSSDLKDQLLHNTADLLSKWPEGNKYADIYQSYLTYLKKSSQNSLGKLL